MKSLMPSLLFTLISFITVTGYKIGAVLREREDAHIAAAIQYTVDWLNRRGIYGEIEYLIDYLVDVDHYAALKKVERYFAEEKFLFPDSFGDLSRAFTDSNHWSSPYQKDGQMWWRHRISDDENFPVGPLAI
uniref:Peptidase_M13_N domain-containing protein n=1 Tax=Angiostrongylus cantonensis TaxID=6313 RepID=A0A0K0CYQ5_ANGCA